MTTPRRRWTFGLRTLFVAVGLLALPLGYVADQWRTAQARRTLRQWIWMNNDYGCALAGPDPNVLDYESVARIPGIKPVHIPYLRTLFGDEAIWAFWLPKAADERVRERFIKWYPEATVSLWEPEPEDSPATQAD